MFPVCNLLTRAKEPGPAKPDSPQFSYVELTLFYKKIRFYKTNLLTVNLR
ncbi:hypothetical protein LEP1GSC176_3360 [Leptospira kirschneri str. MMD1493]|uniref:Uncharacterized protein n=1 Tax=Leptospira kirschneri str. 200802841 TaxID=1193047 RepID=A0A828Y717_9LEPT|nr:hypothetical protein LEP1GSC131_2373 [Leptospira kirschneri str. 200802841]EKR10027.1 hypothetical protein LEP1GSC122_3204 [Leptospira kirschneri serovar Valbuzzi str. 200702274]EMK05289.1 hypothetical protein LEP1GSC176_3360 [Leptospira kirschneri str. MMD1493]